MARAETRCIEGTAPPQLGGHPESEAAYIDKRSGYTTTTVRNVGPDVLTLEPITFVSGGSGANATYTLGAAVNVAAGSSTTVSAPNRMRSAGRSHIRIEDA